MSNIFNLLEWSLRWQKRKDYSMNKEGVFKKAGYVIFGFIIVALYGLRTIGNPEIWTHLSLGQAALSGNLPLNFVSDSTPVLLTPLYNLMVAALWNIGRAPLVTIIHVLAVLVTFGLLINISRQHGSSFSFYVALLISAWMLFPVFNPEPIFFGMMFMSLFLFILLNPFSTKARWLVLIPIQILWTNMHPSFLLGPVIIGIVMVGNKFSIRNSNPTKRTALGGSNSKPLFLLGLACLLATIINPQGLKLYLHLINNLAVIIFPYSTNYVSLFHTQFSLLHTDKLIWIIFLLGAGGLMTFKDRLPPVLTTLAIIGGLSLMYKTAFLPFAIFLIFPFLVLSINSLGKVVSASLEPLFGKNSRLLSPLTGIAIILLGLASTIGILTNASYAQIGSTSSFGLGSNRDAFPSQIGKLLNHPLFPEKTLNLPHDGGYLSWENPGYNTFCDSRLTMLDKEDYSTTIRGLAGDPADWKAVQEKWAPRAVILNCCSPETGRIIKHLTQRKNNWRMVYFDGSSAILLAPSKQNIRLAQDPEVVKLGQAGLQRLEDARKRYLAQLGEDKVIPAEARLIGGAQVLLSLNRLPAACTILELLQQGNPEMYSALTKYGYAKMLLKDYESSIEALEKATEIKPRDGHAWNILYHAYKLSGDEEKMKFALEKTQKYLQPNESTSEEK